MEKIQFQTNVPLEVRLKFLEGKLGDSQFGGQQYMFTTDRGPFWVSESVGNILHDQIRKQRIQTGEPVEICKREVSTGNGRKSIRWEITRVGYAPGEQPDGTFAVPASSPAAGGGAPATSAATQRPTHNTPAASQPANVGQGQNTRPYAAAGIAAPPVKITLDQAVIDAVRMVQRAMNATGEQWDAASRQGLVSTILIQAGKEGWLTMWAPQAKEPQEARHAA